MPSHLNGGLKGTPIWKNFDFLPLSFLVGKKIINPNKPTRTTITNLFSYLKKRKQPSANVKCARSKVVMAFVRLWHWHSRPTNGYSSNNHGNPTDPPYATSQGNSLPHIEGLRRYYGPYFKRKSFGGLAPSEFHNIKPYLGGPRLASWLQLVTVTTWEDTDFLGDLP